MKNIKKIFAVIALFNIIASPAMSFAQSYDDLSGSSFGDPGSGYTWSNFDPVTPVDYGNANGGNSGYSWSDYNPYTPVSYNDLSNTSFYDASTNYGNVSCVGCTDTSNSGYSWTNYNPYTPVSYDNLSNTSFYDASTNYGNVSCAGCSTTNNSGYSWSDYNPYTPVSYNDLSNTSFYDASTNYGNVSCVGCTTTDTSSTGYGGGFVSSNSGYGGGFVSSDFGWGGSTVSTGVTNSSWYDTSYYTTPSYGSIGISYTTPVYTAPVYTTPIYTTTVSCANNLGYYLSGNVCVKQCTNSASVVYPNQCSVVINPTNPTPTCDTANGYYYNNSQCVKQCPSGTSVVYPSTCPTTPTTNCDTASGYYYNGSSCIKQCSNGTSVTYPNQCPVQQSCDINGGYYYQNGVCIKNCPNGGTVTQPNQCPTVTPPVTCDNANGYYYTGSVCVKHCASINGNVTYPNQCPITQVPPVQPTCDTYSGYYYSNGSCIKNCPNGGAVTQPNQCPLTPPTTTCDNANGYYYNLTSCVKYCQSTNGYVTYPNQCPNPTPYYPVPVPNPVQTQVCFDGSVISAYAVCPSPYQVCPDGSLISRNGYCPVINYPTPPVAPVINNVITSIPTQIANTSARCNGIGLIPNNTPSVAWFEYGTTQNLGAKTATANIGTANTSPFTNLLTGLKPSTEYFCRAVMANSLGVVRGDIVHFTTKSKATYYPVATVKKAVKVTKKASVSAPVSTVITCSDGTTLPSSGKVDGTDASSMLESGQKAMSLSLTKTKGDVSPNALVSYFLAFKNESSSNLTDVKVTLILPEEMTLLTSNLGSYDRRTHELSVTYPVMVPAQNGNIEIQVGVAKESVIGKSVAVQAHTSYVIPPATAKGKALTDEVSAYSVNTIISAPLTQVEPPAKIKEVKKSTGTTAGNFLPNTVVEWVALFAILLIIIILVRSIRDSYKGKQNHH